MRTIWRRSAAWRGIAETATWLATGPADKARSATGLRILVLLLAIDVGLLAFLLVETLLA